jgi:alpha,alpha-trehalase
VSDFQTPREIYGALFEAVQTARILGDSKTFVDAVARHPPAEILRRYVEERAQPGFELRAFVRRHFDMPEARTEPAAWPPDRDVRSQIAKLWSTLARAADRPQAHSSLIELPKPYVVPGGRFREMYYWDSYFTMLGLAASGEVRMLEHMVDNFASLVDRIGFIPNGTRTYYATRSQPPFFVLMIELLAAAVGDQQVVDRYAPQLEQEYAFWMAGASELGGGQRAVRRVVRIDDALLNRYWDDAAEPRQESYTEDLALAASTHRDSTPLYRDVRAACESGWDFSSRWFDETRSFDSIRTTEILPVDLNCLLHRLEIVLASTSERAGDRIAAQRYRDRAGVRERMIRSLFFAESEGFFFDVDIESMKPTRTPTVAAAFPLCFGLATNQQAKRVAAWLERDFLRPGGWVTTPANTGQQWDAPNGWAPLQWIVFEGLRRYAFDDLAREGARRWIETNVNTYRKTGYLMEKYNVDEPGRPGSGGEYAVQDGFGWTNGVLLGLLDRVSH